MGIYPGVILVPAKQFLHLPAWEDVVHVIHRNISMFHRLYNVWTEWLVLINVNWLLYA